MTWNYEQPVRISFGNGVTGKLAEEIQALGCQRGILVTSPSFVRRGVAENLVKACDGLLTTVFSHVSPNPEVTECDECAALIREKKCDVVVALGGGSVMDLAKAAATFCLTSNVATDFLCGSAKISAEHLPLIAMPTTAGTGSEITCVSVLSDHVHGLKAPLNSRGFYPAVALVDPTLTHSVPPHLTACTGLDVLCHAVEAYWSKYHQPICDALAVHALRNVLTYLPIAFAKPDDAEAREKMAEASVIAGLAFTVPKTTSAHACSYPLTRLLDIPHGEACALTIDYFMRLNDAMGCTRPQEMAALLGYDSAEALADRITALKRELGLRMDLKDFHLTDEQVEQLVQGSKHPNLLNNPVEITETMLRELYGQLR